LWLSAIPSLIVILATDPNSEKLLIVVVRGWLQNIDFRGVSRQIDRINLVIACFLQSLSTSSCVKVDAPIPLTRMFNSRRIPEHAMRDECANSKVDALATLWNNQRISCCCVAMPEAALPATLVSYDDSYEVLLDCALRPARSTWSRNEGGGLLTGGLP
jgi:hypothetical protein